MSDFATKVLARLDALETALAKQARDRYTDPSRRPDLAIVQSIDRLSRYWESWVVGAFDPIGAAAAAVAGLAPNDPQYLVAAAHAGLPNERVGTSSNSNSFDASVAGQFTFKRAALTGKIVAAADTNATTFGSDARGAAISNPSGGATVDVEARTAVIAILDTMRADKPVLAT